MNSRPPIVPRRQELPFRDPAFTWQTFEAFFCDFLNAQQVLAVAEDGKEIRCEVIRARPFGRPGDAQEGIDILAEVAGGEVWDFQCKHVQAWTPQQTRHAIAAYKRDAARRFLLVTCDVSEECHRVVAEHPGWFLWDAREITRRFRELNPLKAAPILFTHFGPGWAEAFFGIPGSTPLIGAEANFQPQLREEPRPRFHHHHALIGRDDMLRQLDDFVESKDARVFLLIGRGGLGKSRLLLEWSRAFTQKHPGHTLRFVSDKAADFAPALQVAPQPLVLAFDDAHRLDDVRRALLPELPRREGVKLILSLRPGPQEQVMQELLASGFDTTQIVPREPTPMKPLSDEEGMKLVKTALKPEFSHLRDYLRVASGDCPLIAVIGAELINSGALVEADLRDAKEVQAHVFKSLLYDAKEARATFGLQETDDFLRLLALVGPVKLDSTLYRKAAPFLGIATADRVSRLRDALDAAGLLLTTSAGTRVTPDLLSDHLAYDACYDAKGQSRSFAERLLESFSAEDFPKLMQHLAEAEWRATSENRDAASVVEPLWKWFRERFEASPFHQRGDQLQEWGNIAHLQPKRTLELAELALALTTAPEPQHSWQRKYSTHHKSIEALPKMIGPVAEHHPEFVARCFDLLWWLGKDDAPISFKNERSHPLSVMHEVMTFKQWKRLDVLDAALDWVQRLLAGDDWLRGPDPPDVLFERFFHPLLATSIDVTWSTSRTAHFGAVPVHRKNTAGLRQRVRDLLRAVLARRDPQLASQLIPTLERGSDIARIGFGNPAPEPLRSEWDEERLKCLTMLEEVARDFPEALIHFQIRRLLIRDLRYGKDSPAYQAECRRLLKALSDTADFRIARAAFGSYHEEFERDPDQPTKRDWQTAAKARWETFESNVAEEVRSLFPEGEWLDHFAELDARWRAFPGFQPNFRGLLVRLASKHSEEGVRVADRLLREPDHPLSHAFDAVAMSATKADMDRRLTLIRAAAASASETLRATAVSCCAWWRREGELPEDAWQLLESLAPAATTLVAERIATFVWWNDQAGTLRDWRLLAALPFGPHETGLAATIASCAAALIGYSQVRPDADSVARFIDRFDALESVEGDQLERAFQKLAEAFPVAVFLTLWRRNAALKNGPPQLTRLPYDLHKIPFRNLMNAPEVSAIVADFESRALAGESLDFDELRLLRRAIQHGRENPSAWLEAAVARAKTEDHLDLIRQLGSGGGHDNAALTYPRFARALLSRAREISPGCHPKVFRKLLHVGGGRGSTNHEPDRDWKTLLECIERLAHEHAADSELGPLFAAIVKGERSWMDSMQQSWREDDDEE